MDKNRLVEKSLKTGNIFGIYENQKEKIKEDENLMINKRFRGEKIENNHSKLF